MREQNCRKCGWTLKVIKKCLICKKPILFQCVKCKTTTKERLHLGCKPSKLIDKITK